MNNPRKSGYQAKLRGFGSAIFPESLANGATMGSDEGVGSEVAALELGDGVVRRARGERHVGERGIHRG